MPAIPLIPVSVGELVDKLTILELKQQRVSGDALAHVRREQALLGQVFEALQSSVTAHLHQQLRQVNSQLWQVEDAIRACDRQAGFGPPFVALAQQVYRLNDRRAALKRAINLACGSGLIEQKCYAGEA